MADTRYIRPYAALERHTTEMRQQRNQRRIRVGLAVGGGIAAAALTYWLVPPLTVLAVGVAGLVIFFSSITGGSSVAASEMVGVEGEVRALRFLEQLPDDYLLFNQVMVPDERLPNGRRELDFVVLGPSSLHVVEVKNTPGLIYVRPGEARWPLAHKAGCGGRPGWNAVDNPLIQAQAQTEALARWLLRHGLSMNPQPVVCFARSNVALRDRGHSAIPVLTAAELTEHLGRKSVPIPLNQRDAIKKVLAGTAGHSVDQAA